MIVIAGEIHIDPAKRVDAVRAALDMMRETRKEPGCISYTFSGDLEDMGAFRLFEEWESAEALQAHFTSPHMAKFQELMPSLGVKEMKIQRYEVSSVEPVG